MNDDRQIEAEVQATLDRLATCNAIRLAAKSQNVELQRAASIGLQHCENVQAIIRGKSPLPHSSIAVPDTAAARGHLSTWLRQVEDELEADVRHFQYRPKPWSNADNLVRGRDNQAIDYLQEQRDRL